MEHTHDAQGCETARVATLKDATNLVRLLAPDDEDMWGGIMVYPANSEYFKGEGVLTWRNKTKNITTKTK